ncbi:Calx-beta domain-containing protein, partial [Lutibacter sp. B1]|uniref:Calx-beta domain-containing protein n=1 Tax=Lutibacter sp. B1 TaxID=2725996 RepID=UPI001820C119
NVQGGFSVDYQTADGTAIAEDDYQSQSGTLTFTGTTEESHPITVSIADDTLIEPTERLYVNLSNLSTTLIGINDSQGEITIEDNDGGAGNGLTISDITVNEGDGTATVQVTLTGNVQGGFSVDYQTADGTAIAEGDYQSQSATLTFTGDTGETKEIEVLINDDALIEPTERLYVNLSNLSTTLIGINDSQGEITIEDNDGGAGNGLTISDITVNEGDGTATVQVTLTGNVQGGFSVDYQTADGTAIAEDDYQSQSATLTFTGDTGETKEIEVSIADDTLIEPTERLYVNLSNLSTTLIGINDSQGEITIEDNDGGAGNGLTISDITVNEGDGTATVQVTLTGNVQGGFSVDYQTADGTAIAPDDYTVQSATLTFTGDTGETKEIEVSIADDTLIEPTERLYVNLSNLSTMLIGINDSQGEITIEDNDGGAGNGLTISDITVNEGDGTATVQVTLTGNVQGGFSVDYQT